MPTLIVGTGEKCRRRAAESKGAACADPSVREPVLPRPMNIYKALRCHAEAIPRMQRLYTSRLTTSSRTGAVPLGPGPDNPELHPAVMLDVPHEPARGT